ncbi:MAG: alpha/beta fold hydrolase [Candidatus Alcyoniella australis]|nr:alpha/beta fold hydrolase [Candidatus Alcyoniella australis]
MFSTMHVNVDKWITTWLFNLQRPYLNAWIDPPKPDCESGAREPSAIEFTPLRRRRRYRIERFEFDSPLASGYSVNDHVGGIVLTPNGPVRGTVLAIHGWMAHGELELEGMGLLFALKGYRVVLPMLPFHMTRCVPGTFNGQLVVSPQAKLMGIAFDQALAEIRQLCSYLRAEFDGPLVLAGVSLGGLIAAHALQHPLPIDRAYVVIAGADLADTVFESFLLEYLRQALIALRLSEAEVRSRLERFDPARVEPAIDRSLIRLHGGLYDPVFTPRQVIRLGQSWGIEPQFHPAGHVSILASIRKVFSDLP